MATNQKLTFGGFQVNRGMLTAGAALTGLGAVVGLAGTVLVCTALANAGRGWVRSLETQPAELAQRTLHQARAASAAGLEAWRTSVN
ncbi:MULTISPECIES: hypothetical protein [Kitasatospora]|uniref:Uncharacterized protein n=1 Tax=Kitasatospora cineracea TaxID=88074 RepID=A0A3N4RSA6_9ACTN|nr:MULTISPECIES: hypothetical protein [Kitasatospora]ROR43628.1 hypothetical protein EDD39_1794 [Kitasatospora cineracea]RPE33979.1 hypothetical protein EDD38_2286 [Kitasatospora cineracea]WAL72523.1 hypothetical protein OU787_14020 [Kitasatospora sp. YST-16]WNW38574.1 hypothetical protein RKE32_13980 [Streptomyces sp. Li-HN-5-13]